MRCQYAAATDQFHGWECQITGGECVLLIPNEKSCPALIDEDAAQDTAGSISCKFYDSGSSLRKFERNCYKTIKLFWKGLNNHEHGTPFQGADHR